jgi:hypothetical protein
MLSPISGGLQDQPRDLLPDFEALLALTNLVPSLGPSAAHLIGRTAWDSIDGTYALPGPGLTWYGVEYATAQFTSQLKALVIDRPLTRALSGTISPTCRYPINERLVEK